LIIVLCALLAGACASPTPLEQLEESRALYKATLNSFFVKETPLVEEAPADEMALEGDAGEADSMAEEATGAEGEGEEAAAEESPLPVPVRQDAVLDVIVQHDAYEPIAGVTLDIIMVDAEQNELGHWLRWVDTEGLQVANQRPFTIVLEDIPYPEGYGFHVEVRHPVPAAARADYREYEGL
jgi:hypothetical protein